MAHGRRCLMLAVYINAVYSLRRGSGPRVVEDRPNTLPGRGSHVWLTEIFWPSGWRSAKIGETCRQTIMKTC